MMAGPINCPPMLSPSQRAQIKAEIAKPEKEREICNEAGIRKVTEGWIEETEKEARRGDEGKSLIVRC